MEPRTDPYVCLACGAVSDSEGKPLPHECEGEAHEPQRVPALPVKVSHLDPVAKVPGTDDPYPNVYAQRVKVRLAADAAYLQIQALHGHVRAAEVVCGTLGHDARAGFCERCGARTERMEE